MKAILLARVSTEEQKEAGNSLPSQLHRLHEYAERHGFEILQTYNFDESAYKNDRKKFSSVLKDLKQSLEPVALMRARSRRLRTT